MSFKVEIIQVGERDFCSNSIRLPNEEHARRYEADLLGRWYQVKESRVAPSEDPVNHYIDDHGRLTQVPDQYKKIADALKTSITDIYDEADEADAGATFANGYNVQVAPYVDKSFILYKEEGESSYVVCQTTTSDKMVKWIQKNIKTEVQS